MKAFVDFETASEVDLRKTGVWRYAEDPSTIILCLAYAFEDGPAKVWRPGQPFPANLLDHIRDGGEIHAWNALFEIAIWEMGVRQRLLPTLRDEQVRDTMAAVAYWGLPLSLDQAGNAIGATITKDKDGHRLMMQLCKPRGYDPFGRPIWWHEDEPVKYDRLCEYCKVDVLSERDISDRIPALPASELAVWRADLAINRRGVPVDLNLIERLRLLAEQSKVELDKRVNKLTGGAVKKTSQNAKLLAYFNLHLNIPVGHPQQYTSLDKETVKRILHEGCVRNLRGRKTAPLPDHLRELLEIRQEAAKTSVAKLNAVLQAVCKDGRVRGLMQYYGANRTGRWAGRLVQIQNLPRPTLPNVAAFVDDLLSVPNKWSLEEVCVFGTALDCVSSAIRACFSTTGLDMIFTQRDASQIEARVIAWLAGQNDILDVFERGEDVYVYTAKQIGSNDRQLGKVLVLACGFGMGAKRFMETAKTYGIFLTEVEAQDLVDAWRAANRHIKSFWWQANDACIKAIKSPATIHSFAHPGRKCRVTVPTSGKTAGDMLIRLPSGRDLVYRDAQIRQGAYGDEITYMGIDQYTRKWERISTYGGKIAENVTQAVARDILAEATVRIEAKRPGIVMSVHDELVREDPLKRRVIVDALMAEEMNKRPHWALDLPLASDGWQGDRYRK